MLNETELAEMIRRILIWGYNLIIRLVNMERVKNKTENENHIKENCNKNGNQLILNL